MDAKDDNTIAKLKKLFAEEIQGTLGKERSSEVTIKAPLKVEPLNSTSSQSYWRVPYQLSGATAQAGYFDVRELESPVPRIVRKSVPSSISVSAESAKPHADLTGMDRAATEQQVKATFGPNATIIGEPSLVYDRAETRIAWKAEVRDEGSTFIALVTPGLTWRVQPETSGADTTE